MSTPELVCTVVGNRERAITARLNNYGQRAIVYWGDETTSRLEPGRAVLKVYDRPGAYTATATSESRTKPHPRVTVLATAPVIVQDGLTPEVSHSHNPEWGKENEHWITVDAPDLPGNLRTPLKITWPANAWWPDDMLDQIVYPAHGDVITRGIKPGDWDITITDLATKRTRTDSVTVPETVFDPDATFTYRTPEDDPDGLTIDLTLTRVQAGRPLRVYWTSGDAYHWQPVDNPSNGLVLPHTYDPADIWNGGTMITLAYDTDDEGHGQYVFVDLPRPA